MTEKRHVFGSVFNHVLLLRFRFRFFTIRWRNEEEKVVEKFYHKQVSSWLQTIFINRNVLLTQA